MGRKLNSEKGFSIAEVLLATAIAVFAICGMLLMYVVSVDLILTSKNASIATSAAQGIIEEIRAFPVPFKCLQEDYNCSSSFCQNNCEKGGYNNFPFVVNGIQSSVGVVHVIDDALDSKLITVNVSWPQNNRADDLTVELAAQVANR